MVHINIPGVHEHNKHWLEVQLFSCMEKQRPHKFSSILNLRVENIEYTQFRGRQCDVVPTSRGPNLLHAITALIHNCRIALCMP